MFYKNYAEANGFTVRKDRSTTRHGKAIRRDLYCHRGGKKPLKPVHPSKSQRNRESSKCECNAHMRFTLKRTNAIFPEEWHVTKFIKQHNHNLLSPTDMRLLPINRIITAEDESQILLYKEARLSVRQTIRVMELQKQVKHGDLSFIKRDVHNLFVKMKKLVEGSDAQRLIEDLKCAKQKEENFQYICTMDENRRLENVFWCHAQSFEWYKKYGDVVVFDTTYKVNAYDMPCAFFVGIDNHGKTILFGSALLMNETTLTFRWLMKTFVTTMKKAPKTIVTDQDPWMSEAIAIEMPTTKHSFCIWHITSKFRSWFTALLKNEYQKWCADFYELYKIISVEDFEQNWPLIVAKYNMQNNRHVQGLYKIRTFWAPCYLRGYFFGGMTTTGRCESINAFIKRFVSSHTNLSSFFKQVELAVEELSQVQSQNTLVATLKSTSLLTKSPLEEQAFQVLTPFALKKFQEEFKRVNLYFLLQVECHKFTVRYYEGIHHKNHNVFWDEKNALCSCKNFEFWGILCRHILRVFAHTNCFKIPTIYLPKRWCSEYSQRDDDMSQEV